MEDFGTFFCIGFGGYTGRWRVYADIDPKTKKIDFIRLQQGTGTMPGRVLRPNECLQPHQYKALAHVRAQIRQSNVTQDDSEVIDEEDC